MNLPNYFLADLPSEAALTPQMVAEACATLKHNREQYLAARSTHALVGLISEVAGNWLNEAYPFRKLALNQRPQVTGFARHTLAVGLDHFFRQLTRENLHALLTQDLGHAKRLDELVAAGVEERGQRAAFAAGPEFLVHIAAGNIPNPTLMSMVLGLLTRSAQFVKCARGTSFLPRLFAHSIYDADHKLGACLELAEWRGGEAALEQALLAEADCVTATGDNQTLAAVRAKLPSKVRFLGYGHRVSFGFVASGALSGFRDRRVVQQAATDVVAWNQLGCLSPHVIYVEHGGGVSAEQFAALLAEELERREAEEPRGALPVELASTIASRRAFYEVRAAHSPDTRMWCSEHSTAWTVVYEADPKFQASCLHRFVYVKGTPDLASALRGADELRGMVSTVGLAAPEDQAAALAQQLARWGVARVCPLGQMQNPPLTWRHDARPALGDLVTWMDWEQ